MPKPKRELPLRCSLPPTEALRLAMLVKPPGSWKRSKPGKKSRR